MSPRKYPRLRTVEKVRPPYPINNFPKGFGISLGRELVYLLATKRTSSLIGEEWEQIFSTCIGAKWKPSNVGLDDVVLGSCAWGAKTVKGKPASQEKVRLISGRNSPIYSFDEKTISKVDPDHLGSQVLDIWNERVSAIRKIYKHVRTVVLIKSEDLSKVAVFEFETVRYDPDIYEWVWNKRGNLECYDKSKIHCFTWQPHGSQFTIIEPIPDNCLLVSTKIPKKLDKDILLKGIGFKSSWVKVYYRND